MSQAVPRRSSALSPRNLTSDELIFLVASIRRLPTESNRRTFERISRRLRDVLGTTFCPNIRDLPRYLNAYWPLPGLPLYRLESTLPAPLTSRLTLLSNP